MWHLGAEGSSDQPDSVAGGNSFLLNTTYADGVRAGTNGVAGLAVAFNQRSDGKGVYYIDDTARKYCGFDKLTVEYWTYQDDHNYNELSSNTRVLFKPSVSDLNKPAVWSAYESSNGIRMGLSFLVEDDDNEKYVIPQNNAGNRPPRAAWNHTVSVFDGTADGVSGGDTVNNRAAYLNGNSMTVTSTTSQQGTMISSDQPLCLGNKSGLANISFAVYEGPQLDWTVYGKKFPLTFDGVTDGATLTDFPVLVRISEYDEATGKGIQYFDYDGCLLPDGGDLRFADENGTLLMSEVDTWNANGESLVWVKIPALTKGTKIWAYYGSKYAHAVNPKAVWSNGFLGVWHLGAEGSSDQPDSVAGGNPFVLNSTYADGVQAGTNGIAGLAAAFNQRSDGKGAYSITDSAKKYSGFDKFTVEYWTYYDDHGVGGLSSNARVLYKDQAWSSFEAGGNASGNGRMGLYLKLDGVSGEKYVNPTDIKANKAQPEVWNHTVSIFNGTYQGVGSDADTKYNRAVYLNGTSLLTATSDNQGTMVSNANTLYLGNNKASGTQPYHGIIDEVRISTVTRSAAWVKATYDTIANNAAFVAYGAARQNNKGGLMVFIR